MSIIDINRDSWNKQADRYQKNATFSFDEVDYGNSSYPKEKDLKLIGDVKGKKILELGCGGANCGIALAKQGAKMTCLDLSSEQIKYAQNYAKRENVDIRFITSAIEDTSNFESKEFDKVISICAFMYVKDIDKVFQEVNRMLKLGGTFVFSLNDPIFYSVAFGSIWKEDGISDNYFYTGEEKWKWLDSDDFDFITYRRPIYEYINFLIDAGFSLERFYEFESARQNASEEEIALYKKYPSLMVFKANKVRECN